MASKTNKPSAGWEERLKRGSLRIGILGMGYVGLPLGLLFAEKGHTVIGYDPDSRRMASLKKGRSPIRHIASSRVASAVKRRKLRATDRAADLAGLDAALICVPTPLTKQREPDLSYVESAARLLAPHATNGMLIVLESTTYPGTTRDVVLPILTAAGRKAGRDFHLAYSPEREDPNNARFSTASIPKLVGGINSASSTMAAALYAQIIGSVVPVASCEVAEAAKLLENIFRSVNIALVNELKMVLDRMGIDVWQVIEAAGTKPFGFMPFYPGPGLGGHCIPIDPFYLTWKAREFELPTKFIELAGEINTAMPYYVLGKCQDALNTKGKGLRRARVLVMGLAYKKDVEDIRESPALKLMELLERGGAVVDYHDPHVPQFEGGHGSPLKPRASAKLSAAALRRYDLVLVATNHTAVDYRLVRRQAALIVDTRRVWKPDFKKVFPA